MDTPSLVWVLVFERDLIFDFRLDDEEERSCLGTLELRAFIFATPSKYKRSQIGLDVMLFLDKGEGRDLFSS
jgi:hypothetical protein